MILAYISSGLSIVYCVLIVYYSRLWKAIPRYNVPKDFIPSTKISVIVPARNEEKNIAACINSLINQHYPSELLQIIIVDDESEDGTWIIASSLSDSRLLILSSGDNKATQIPQLPGKKRAIATAIEHSTGSLIITTDADCLHPVHWLETLVAFYEEKKPVFIAAPVKYSNPKNYSAIFQSLDFMSLQGVTAAGVYHSKLMMCNGANLAYEKQAFHETGGFTGIDQLASGDDLLLMQKIAKKEKRRVMYCLADEAIVSTLPAGSWSSFFQQRLRWASKARSYSDISVTAVLVLVYCLNMSLLFLLITSLKYPMLFIYWIILLAVKTVIELIFLIPVARFFNQQSLLWYFLPSQPLHIIYTVLAGFFGQVKRYEWKGRNVK